MIKTFYAVIVSAIAAGCFVAFPILSQQVHANPPTQVFASASIDAPEAADACGQNNTWPYLDAACLRGAGGSMMAPHDVRFVSADRRVGSNDR
jgi:hypothetical protein